MELAVVNIEGKETGRKVKLEDSIFAIEPNDHAIYLDSKHFMATLRQGTHKSKERAEIAGSTRKIKRQKGTGTARFGSIKNPLFRGGGRVFGPRPRYYGFKLNKKVKQLARKSALSYKAREKKIIVLGPAPAPVEKLRGKYRFHVLIRSGPDCHLQPVIQRASARIQTSENVQWIVRILVLKHQKRENSHVLVLTLI